MKKIETKITNFRTWKKGKKWIYAGTTLAVLAGGVAVSTGSIIPQQIVTVFAEGFVNGTQIGVLREKPVIKSEVIDMGGEEFQQLVDSIIKNQNLDNVRYVADTIQWNESTDVVADGIGTMREKFNVSNRHNLKQDGFLDSDKGKYVNPGDFVYVTDVGTVTDIQTNTKIPVHLKITYISSTHGNDGNKTDDVDTVGMAVKSQAGVITVGFSNLAAKGATAIGGQTESGHTGPGGATGRLGGYIESVEYTVTLVNAETGEPIPDEELLMAMKMSDIDAKQLAYTDEKGVIAYIASPDTKLAIQEPGLASTSSEAFNADTTQLSANSYIVLKQKNTASVGYYYTDNARNHLTIVTGVFGNTGFELNVDTTGTLVIDKSGQQTGKSMWNDKYSLAGNTFKVTNKETGAVVELHSDAKGRVTAELPFGTYIVEEISASNGFVKTFATQEVTIDINTPKATINGKEDQLVTVTGTNKEITGKNTLVKRDKDTQENAQGKATLKTAQYQLFHAETNEPIKWTANPTPQLLAGEKVSESIVNGQVVSHGDNVVIDVDDNSLAVSIGNLPLGRYYWQEVNAPEGYAIDGNRHEFTIEKADDNTEVVTAEDKRSLEQVIKAKISLQKLLQASSDLNSSGYNDISFTFTPLDNTKAQAKTVVTAPKGDEDGFASVELEYGDWMLTEDNAPEGYKAIEPIYIHMSTDEKTDVITITASHNSDGSQPFSKRTFVQSDNNNDKNTHTTGSVAGVLSSSNIFLSLSRLTVKNNTVEIDKDDFQPEKFVLNEKAFDVTGTNLLDDDAELSDKYADTNANPYVDTTDNNEASNINTKLLSRGDVIYYQVWLDTTQFEQDDKVTALGITDKFSRHFTIANTQEIKVYDKQTGQDVTGYFDIVVNERELTVQVNDNGKSNGIVDTNKVAFGRYYVIDIPGTVSDETPAGEDIENVAEQFVTHDCSSDNDGGNGSNPTGDTPATDGKTCEVTTKPTQKRVNKVKDPEFEPHKFVVNQTDVDVTGNSLLDDDSELNDRYADTANDPYADQADNNEASNLNTKTVVPGQKLTYQLWLDTTGYVAGDKVQSLALEDTFDSERLVPEDVSTITVKDSIDGKDYTEYFDKVIENGVLRVVVNDNAKKTIQVNGQDVMIIDTEKLPFGRYYKVDFTLSVADNVTVGEDIKNVAKQIVVDHNGKTSEKVTETRVNKVEEPTFNPHKFVVSQADVDITGNSLLDDDSELTDRYSDTNANPYTDKVDNNEQTNINTHTLDKEQALTYQLWLDTTPYTQHSRLSELGMRDDFDEQNLDINGATISIKDGADGKDVTEYFNVEIVDGVLIAKVNDKAKKTVVLGDKEVSIIDTEKLPLGRYYKVDFTVKVSAHAKADTDIVNTASQFVGVVDSNGNDKLVEKPTEKRVNKLKSNPLQILLPKTGDSTIVWWSKVVGWLSLIGAIGLFIKRRTKKDTK